MSKTIAAVRCEGLEATFAPRNCAYGSSARPPASEQASRYYSLGRSVEKTPGYSELVRGVTTVEANLLNRRASSPPERYGSTSSQVLACDAQDNHPDAFPRSKSGCSLDSAGIADLMQAPKTAVTSSSMEHAVISHQHDDITRPIYGAIRIQSTKIGWPERSSTEPRPTQKQDHDVSFLSVKPAEIARGNVSMACVIQQLAARTPSLCWAPPPETPSTSAGGSAASTPRQGGKDAQSRRPSLSWDAPLVSARTQAKEHSGERRCGMRPLRELLAGSLAVSDVRSLCEGIFFESMPRENVADLVVEQLNNARSQQRFTETVRNNGGWQRVRAAWHFPGGEKAAESILRDGIACDDRHCACGRYGRGGYVAMSAAKAHAYADSFGEGGPRHVFLVLALPEQELIAGEKDTRPQRTAADLPSHPTEMCFVDPARLHCACLLKYTWLSTGRRQKVYAAAPRISHVAMPQRDDPRRSLVSEPGLKGS